MDYLPIELIDKIVEYTDFETAVKLKRDFVAEKLYGSSNCTFYSAASGGHLEVVKWLHFNRVKGCTVIAMNIAAENGHLEVVEWLYSNREEGFTVKAMDWAALEGYLEVVEWLHLNTDKCRA